MRGAPHPPLRGGNSFSSHLQTLEKRRRLWVCADELREQCTLEHNENHTPMTAMLRRCSFSCIPAPSPHQRGCVPRAADLPAQPSASSHLHTSICYCTAYGSVPMSCNEQWFAPSCTQPISHTNDSKLGAVQLLMHTCSASAPKRLCARAADLPAEHSPSFHLPQYLLLHSLWVCAHELREQCTLVHNVCHTPLTASLGRHSYSCIPAPPPHLRGCVLGLLAPASTAIS